MDRPDAVTPSTRLQIELEAVRRFHEALQPYIAQYRPTRDATDTFALLVPIGDEEEREVHRRSLAAAAGPAARIAEKRRLHMNARGRRVNPIAAWEEFFRSEPVMWPKSLDAFSRALVAQLEHEVQLAQDRERGVVGLIARFVRLPLEVREAAGLTGRSGVAATGFILVIQGLLVTVIGGVLVALILRLLGSSAALP
jgi:hypothetical protein